MEAKDQVGLNLGEARKSTTAECGSHNFVGSNAVQKKPSEARCQRPRAMWKVSLCSGTAVVNRLQND